MANMYDQIFHNAYWSIDPNTGNADEDNRIRSEHAQNVMGAEWAKDHNNQGTYSQDKINFREQDNDNITQTLNLERAQKENPDKTLTEIYNDFNYNKNEDSKKGLPERNIINDVGDWFTKTNQRLFSGIGNFVKDSLLNRNAGKEVIANKQWGLPTTEQIINTNQKNANNENSINNINLNDVNNANDAYRKMIYKTNDLALKNIYNRDKNLASQIGTIKPAQGKTLEQSLNDNDFSVDWTPEENRTQTAKDFMNSHKNMNFWYASDAGNFTSMDDIMPYLDETTKAYLDQNNTLANQNETQSNYWLNSDGKLTNEQKANQLYQSFRGPSQDYGYKEKWKNQERQGGDTENYGDAGKEMYNGQDILWFQQGYHPDTGLIRNDLNARNITKGDTMQTLEDFEKEQLEEQPVSLDEIYERDPSLIARDFTNGGVYSLNNTTNALSRKFLESPTFQGSNPLKEILDQTKQAFNLKDNNTTLQELENKYKEIEQSNNSNVSDKNKQQAEQFINALNRNQGLLNTIIMAADMANNGQQSFYNPGEDIVKQYFNFNEPDGRSNKMYYRIYENPYELSDNKYSSFDSSALINALKQTQKNQFDAEDSKDLLNEPALQEAVRRARRA